MNTISSFNRDLPLAGTTKVTPASTPQLLAPNTVAMPTQRTNSNSVPWSASKRQITGKAQQAATTLANHEGTRYQPSLLASPQAGSSVPGVLHHISLRPVVSLSSQAQKPEPSRATVSTNSVMPSAPQHLSTTEQVTKNLLQATRGQSHAVKSREFTIISLPKASPHQAQQLHNKTVVMPQRTQNQQEHQQEHQQTQLSQQLSAPQNATKFTVRHINLTEKPHTTNNTFVIRHVTLPTEPNELQLHQPSKISQPPIMLQQQQGKRTIDLFHENIPQQKPNVFIQVVNLQQQIPTQFQPKQQQNQIHELNQPPPPPPPSSSSSSSSSSPSPSPSPSPSQQQQQQQQKFVLRHVFIPNLSKPQSTLPPSNHSLPLQKCEKNIQKALQAERAKEKLQSPTLLEQNHIISTNPQPILTPKVQPSTHPHRQPYLTAVTTTTQHESNEHERCQQNSLQMNASRTNEQIPQQIQSQHQPTYTARRINLPSVNKSANEQVANAQHITNILQNEVTKNQNKIIENKHLITVKQSNTTPIVPLSLMEHSQQLKQQKQQPIVSNFQPQTFSKQQPTTKTINKTDKQNQQLIHVVQPQVQVISLPSTSLQQQQQQSQPPPPPPPQQQQQQQQQVPKFKVINISKYLQKQKPQAQNLNDNRCIQDIANRQRTTDNREYSNNQTLSSMQSCLSKSKAFTTLDKKDNATPTSVHKLHQQNFPQVQSAMTTSHNSCQTGTTSHFTQKGSNAPRQVSPLLNVPSECITMKTEVVLSVVDEHMLRVSCNPELKPVLVEMVKMRQSFVPENLKKSYCDLGFSDYPSFIKELSCLSKSFIIKTIPQHFFQITSLLSHLLPFTSSKLPEEKFNKLFEYQKEGVKFAVQRNGNCIIADDMGLGKTVQALLVGLYFKESWPMLIICPSSLRYQWADMAESWCGTSKVSIVESSKCSVDGDCVVISYTLAATMIEQLTKRGFGFIIVDESHYLKNSNTVRSNAILPFLHKAAHTVLLTGTPMVGGPIDLYNQLYAVCKTLHLRQIEFGKRYCEGFYSPGRGWNFKGSSNTSELNTILKAVMIRRKKSEVLQQLPPKTRERVFIGVLKEHKNVLQRIQHKMSTKELKKMNEGERQSERHRLVLEYFRNSGAAKMPVVCEYIEERFFGKANQQKKSGDGNSNKIVVFAHHKDVLDGISMSLRKNKIEFVRVDGETNGKNRLSLIEAFNTEENIKVALLSLTACSTGLNCTAAQTAIFAELFWNPSTLRQAEDRIHRIGQKYPVTIQYLVARNTVDEMIWSLIEKKLAVVSEVLNEHDKESIDDKEEIQAKKQNQMFDDILKVITSFEERNNEYQKTKSLKRKLQAEYKDNQNKRSKNDASSLLRPTIVLNLPSEPEDDEASQEEPETNIQPLLKSGNEDSILASFACTFQGGQ